MTIKIGQKVRDVITGFEGIATCRAEWLNGCIRISIQPPVDKEGKNRDAMWVDEPQCELIADTPEPPQKKRGGPRCDPSRSF